MTRVDGGRDVLVGVLGATVAVWALTMAFWPFAGSSIDEGALAAVTRSVGEVKRRPAALLGWQRLVTGMAVANGDSVFVPPGTEVVLRFDDGTELTLDERSLVVVERPREGGRRLRLQQGSLTGRVGAQSVDIATPQGLARLAKASEARVEVGARSVEVDVKKGQAVVTSSSPATGSRDVTVGQRVAVGERIEVLSPRPVTLLDPDAHWHQVFKGAPAPLELSWSGPLGRGARLQTARDRLFAFIDQDVAVTGQRFSLTHPSAGVTWWRLVDAEGHELSEARRFVFTEDVAPVGITPREGALVLAPPGSELLFGWSPLIGVTKYRLEISMSQGFEPLKRSIDVVGADTRVSLGLAEGTWYYRVRAAEGETLGLASQPIRFRLIHRGIPDAPELLTPEIEVGH